ncbi:MAG: dTDP-4-dehydrorhamnose 3,5-epimerase [Gammaproteobacteria bacterium]|nr:dTDP-4-dehydrorhamnose 3,5-epimerase [Gammaproteobacteria bacterium]
MKIIKKELKGVYIVERKTFSDERGEFSRLYCNRELEKIIDTREIVQINLSRNKIKGCIRGLHFQYPPHAEMKIVSCLKGEIYDVAVDLRPKSKSYLQSYGNILTAQNQLMMITPEGFAHGYQSLTEDTEVLYASTSHYKPEFEGGLRFNDPVLNINWPMEHQNISEKDLKHALIDKSFSGIEL